MPPNLERRRFDVLFILAAEPYHRDTLTTTLRLAQAVLDAGRTVRVWACGYNVMLTQEGLGEVKPVNVHDPRASYPSTASVIRKMINDHDGRLSWLVCTVCSAERGAGPHIREVRLRSAPRFPTTIAAADRVIYAGGS